MVNNLLPKKQKKKHADDRGRLYNQSVNVSYLFSNERGYEKIGFFNLVIGKV